MTIDFKNCSEEDLWKFVGSHLARNGIDAVLVGGAVVSIYSDGIYKSGDLDFVIQNFMKENLPKIMEEIGFIRKGRHYIHPDCRHLFVEFPSGPLGIGEDYSIKPAKHLENGVKLKILSPTDCVKDRLASFIYFQSREGLEQSLLVASRHPVNKAAIKKWCIGEGASWAYEEFLNQLNLK